MFDFTQLLYAIGFMVITVLVLIVAGALYDFIISCISTKCPYCNGEMFDVYGWNKKECSVCGYTKKIY